VDYWTVTFPTKDGLRSDHLSATGEADARLAAATWSRDRGHATVTNQAGPVATYVNGQEWHSPTTEDAPKRTEVDR
jgi:hypothetical protein